MDFKTEVDKFSQYCFAIGDVLKNRKVKDEDAFSLLEFFVNEKMPDFFKRVDSLGFHPKYVEIINQYLKSIDTKNKDREELYNKITSLGIAIRDYSLPNQDYSTFNLN
jgi:hypothetical protein